MLLLLNMKIHSAMCRWKLVGIYFWGKMKGRWRINIMKDLIQAWTSDFLMEIFLIEEHKHVFLKAG